MRESGWCLPGFLVVALMGDAAPGDQAVATPLPRHQLYRISATGSWQPVSPSDLEALSSPVGRTLALGPDQVEELPVLTPAHPFHEVLPSWNISVPADAGFRVDLRVAAREENWSPWMPIGSWGAATRGSGKAASTDRLDGGRVHVDIFRSKQLHRRLQLRLVGGGVGGALTMERLAVSVTDWSADHRAEPISRGQPLQSVPRIPVPFRSQQAAPEELRRRICSPTSVAMMLEHHGKERSTVEVARLLFDEEHDLYGNWGRAIQGAASQGVPGLLVRISDWNDVSRLLAAGQPLVVSIGVKEGQLSGAPYTSTAGHLLVFTGIDERGDLRVNDPAAADPSNGQTVYRRDELDVVWRQRGGTAYLLLSPDAD